MLGVEGLRVWGALRFGLRVQRSGLRCWEEREGVGDWWETLQVPRARTSLPELPSKTDHPKHWILIP